MADMMMTAGVHATGDIEVERADVMQIVEIVELLLNGPCYRNGSGIRQAAVIAAGARDYIGQQADIGRSES